MRKKTVSNDELTAIFVERLSQFPECPKGTSIAIIPTKRAQWTVRAHRRKTVRPQCTRRIEAIQKQLLEIYRLASD